MSYELATAYVNVVASTRGMGRQLNQDLGGAADSAGSNAGKRSGAKFGGAFAGVVKKAGLIGAGITAALAAKGGIARALSIEDAQAKLAGLGHSTENVQKIMDNAMASVKGTAFGMGDAATVAAGVVAAGVKPGQELERTLKLVGDSATIAGTGMGDMGAIFNKVAASNKIQGDTIAQLNDAGIPIIQLLGDELGKTAEETVKMASKGEIGFATFQNAMEKGLGGAALKSGETFRGSMANVKAALGRIGETVMSPFLDGIKSGANKLIPILDGFNKMIKPIMAKVGPLIATATDKIGPIFANVWQSIQPFLQGLQSAFGPAISVVVDAFAKLGPQLATIVQGFSPLNLIMQAIQPLMPLLAQAFQAVGTALAQIIPPIAQIAVALQTALVPLISQIISTLLPPLISLFTQIAPIFTDIVVSLVPLVTAILGVLVPAIQALLPVVKTVFEAIGPIISAVLTIVQGIIKTITALITGDWEGFWAGIGQILTGIWETIKAVVQGAINIVLSIVQNVGGLIGQAWDKIWGGISSFFSGIWNGITGFVGTAIKDVQGKIAAVLMVVKALWDKTWSGISGFLSDAWKNITTAVSDGVGKVGKFFQDLPGEIGGFLAGLPGKLLDVGNQMMQGLINGIGNAGQWVKDKIGDVINGAINWGKSLLGIHSPSRVFRDQIGKQVTAGLAVGITANYKLVKDAITKVSKSLTKTAESLIKAETKRLQEARRKQNAQIAKLNKKLGKKVTNLGSLSSYEATKQAKSQLGSKASKKTVAARAKQLQQERRDLLKRMKGGKLDSLGALSKADAEKQAKKNVKGQLAAIQRVQKLVAQQSSKSGMWNWGTSTEVTKMITGALTKGGNWTKAAKKSRNFNNVTLADLAKGRENVAARLGSANDKLKTMLDTRTQFQDQIKGELDLRAGFGQDTTDQWGYTTKGKTTFESVAGQVKSLAKRAKNFAGKLQALLKAGIPRGLVTEIAGYGTEEGIKVADALLDSDRTQRDTLRADYSSLNFWSGKAGDFATEAMYGVGLDSQRGLIKGLEADDKKLKAAAENLIKKLAKYSREAAGIHSPSRLFRDEVGSYIPLGVVAGIDQEQGTLDKRVQSMIKTASPSIQAGLGLSFEGEEGERRTFTDADLRALAEMLQSRPNIFALGDRELANALRKGAATTNRIK